jgi:hypothetical protein
LLRTLSAAFVCLVVGLASCAQRSRSNPASAALPISQIPGLGLDRPDDIDSTDLAVAPSGDLHVVWRAVVKKESATPAHPVLYLRGERGGQAWGRPVEVDPTGDPPRIALTADAVHVLFGPRLRHFVAPVAGEGRAAFQELAPLVPANRGRALAFDVLGAEGGLLIAYLLEVPAQGAAAGALELHTAGGGLPDRVVARFPASVLRQPSPRLVAGGGRLRLLCAVNSEERRTAVSNGRNVEELAPAGRVFYLDSGDGGATWTPPVEVTPGGRSRPAVVQAVELMARPGEIVAVYSAFGLRAARSADGRTWSAPVVVAPYEISLSRGSTESGAVAAAPGPEGGVLAWIDARFQNSDRRWWNPLGGVPWSDDNPLWANNDVFALRLPEVEAALAGRPVTPRRLTSPLSSAHSLRAGAGPEGRAILLWAGRRRVGKHPDTFHEPPVLSYVRLP